MSRFRIVGIVVAILGVVDEPFSNELAGGRVDQGISGRAAFPCLKRRRIIAPRDSDEGGLERSMQQIRTIDQRVDRKAMPDQLRPEPTRSVSGDIL